MPARRRFRPNTWDALEERVVLNGASRLLDPFGIFSSLLGKNSKPKPLTVGTLGDSYTDEYKFYAAQSHARNWVEILANNRNISFGSFSNASRGEPRDQGFAYNWARDNATSIDMINNQLPGLTAQVKGGVVQVATIFIGGNDFLDLLAGLKLGQVTPQAFPAQLAQTEATLQANVETAVSTLLQANSKVKLVVSTLPDVGLLPIVKAGATDAQLQSDVAAVGQAIQQYNTNIMQFVTGNPRIAVVNLAAQSAELAQLGAANGGAVPFGGTTVNVTTAGNDYHDFFVGDGIHVGTIGQGIIADDFISAIDTQLGGKIRQLTPEQIVRYARTVQNQTRNGHGGPR